MKKTLLFQIVCIFLIYQTKTGVQPEKGTKNKMTNATKFNEEVVKEMEAAGFKNVRNESCSEFGLYLMVIRGISTVKGLGAKYFEENTTCGPKLKEIIYKFSNQ